MTAPPLPPGFQLVGASAAVPPLPPGFQIASDPTDWNAELQKENNDSMSGFEQGRVAFGRGMLDVGQGLKQLLLRGADAISVIPGGAHLADKYTQEVQDERASYDQGRLRQDAPATAVAGRLLGNVAAMPLPAGKGATLLSKVLGGAAAGATAGAVQFVPEGESRLQNTALGAVVGGVLPGVIQAGKVTVGAVRDLAGKLKDLMPAVSHAAREQMAAKILREAVADPSKLARAAQNTQLIPGTQQTLAEATDDVGLAGLQRTMQSMSPEFNSRVAGVAQQNNAARVEALRGGFGGADEASAAALEAARDRATAPLLAAARKVKGVDTKPTVTLANRILKAREGNDTVTSVVGRVRDLLAREGMDDVQKLHNARQEIGTILSGQSSMEQAGKTATRELMAIRESLDAQIAKSSPEFRQFLTQYASLSKDAGRVRMGDELLGKSFATLDNMGNPVLSPAKFATAANDLDRVAKAATGFRKETADRLMTGEQKALVGNVRADLDRYARSQTGGKAVGSNSLQNAAGMARLQDVATNGNELQAALLPQLTLAKSLFNGVRKRYGEKVLSVVQEAMLNPQRANQLLKSLPPAQQAQAQAVLQSSRMQQIGGIVQAIGPTMFANAAVAQGQD